MNFAFECVPGLPKLAWAARLRKNEPSIQVLHGSQVEIRNNCFFEGAWEGPFETFDFDQASTVAGSGARIRNGHVVFTGPSHLCERLQSVRVGDELFLSNSLPFLLALSGERLDPKHPHYYWDFLDFFRAGIKVKVKRLRLQGPRFAELHDCCSLKIASDLTITRLEQPMDPAPRDFTDYRSFLERTLKAVIANAGHPARRWRYRPVTMVSQGYDSPAVSALASRAGCREAVTFRNSGSSKGYEDDCGTAIAGCLGLGITEYERMDFEKLPEYRADEFYIEPWGADRHMAVMEKQVAGSLLLSGRCVDNIWPYRGGRHWGPLNDTGLPDLQDVDAIVLGGCAMGEFRMRTGFIDFPLANSGARNARAIHSIGKSKEMKPWVIPNRYNKPIARRLAEEAGVPRELFGQAKKGGPARPVEVSPSLLRRIRIRVGGWKPWRVAGIRLFGNRFHPDWNKGSFEVQRSVDRAVERYVAALSEMNPAKRFAATEP